MKEIFILALLCPLLYKCQPVTVKGKVINEEGDPVVGATITVRRTAELETPIPDTEPPAVSGEDGTFIFPNRLPHDTLIITAAGYETAYQTFNLRGLVTVVLKRKAASRNSKLTNGAYRFT